MAERFEIEPLAASFGAKLTSLDVRRLSNQAFSEIYDLWLKYGLLFFPGQFLSNVEQSDFA